MSYAWYFIIYLLFIGVASARECDRSQCKGPLRYYEQLKCKPIYENSGDCCAIRYDCSDFIDRKISNDKCYYGGEEYAIGEGVMKKLDVDSCSESVCSRSTITDELQFFQSKFTTCTSSTEKQTSPNCYVRHSHDSCCGEKVCLDSIENRYKCEVDGKRYLDGEEFKPKADPTLICYCTEGYEGENVEPFCKNDACGYELDQHFQEYVRNGCPPFYSDESSLADDCPIHLVCEYDGEVKLVKKNDADQSAGRLCKFSDRTFNVGDTLYYAESFGHYQQCTKCECEVPPAPSCRRIPEEECIVEKKHASNK